MIAKEKLEQLRERVKFDVIPAQFQTEQSYSRSVTLDVKSELAGVIKLMFRLTHDSDVRQISLAYDLQIVPVFFRFNALRVRHATRGVRRSRRGESGSTTALSSSPM